MLIVARSGCRAQLGLEDGIKEGGHDGGVDTAWKLAAKGVEKERSIRGEGVKRNVLCNEGLAIVMVVVIMMVVVWLVVVIIPHRGHLFGGTRRTRETRR